MKFLVINWQSIIEEIEERIKKQLNKEDVIINIDNHLNLLNVYVDDICLIVYPTDNFENASEYDILQIIIDLVDEVEEKIEENKDLE